jgi:two-component system response regulator AtoC
MTARLAIVDDDPAFTDFLQTLLRTQGYAVDVYHSGTSLLEGLRAGAAPNVVLLDVLMPDLDGIETLRAIRSAHPAAQVIMLSGRQAPATIVEAVRLGAADYVLKPGDPDGVGEAALESAIRNALERESLSAEVARLGAQMAEDPEGAQPCWSSGPAMQSVMAMVERVADSDVGVLLRGESGVGKEVIARELHRRSSRRTKTFVKVNCAALPADLLESELFGHERGAFTGATSTKAGLLESADGGTFFLDEVGELSMAIQAKLLRVLEAREVMRIGALRPHPIDVRFISATNRDLLELCRARGFRADLYHRLNGISLTLPPLRERRGEVASLARLFVARACEALGRPVLGISATTLARLEQYPWPGNVRELRNTMDRAVLLCPLHEIAPEHLKLEPDIDRSGFASVPPSQPMSSDLRHDLAEIERARIAAALAENGGNQTKTAAALGISRRTLLSRLDAHGFPRPRKPT